MGNSKSRNLIRDLTSGPLAKQLVLFALPIMGANLLQALYTMVDLWVVGQFASSAAISAVSISSQIVILIHSAGIGLGNGGQVLISQLVGGKEYDRLAKAIGTLVSVCALISIVVTALGAGFSNFWLDLMNTPGEALLEARSYLLVCSIGVPFVYVGATLCAVLRGLGDSRRPMYILAVSTLTNIALDILFVAKFRWGAAGAAWATSIAQIITFVFALIFLYRNRAEIGFDFKPASFRIDVPMMKIILKLGMPLVVMTAAITLSMLVVTAWVNVYGVAASAIMGIGSKLISLVNVVVQSMQTAAGSLIAQNFAAGQMGRVRRAVGFSLAIGAGCFVFIGGITLLFPAQIVGIFSPDAEVLAMAPEYMFVMFWMFFSLMLMAPPIALINGVGFTTLNLIIALLDGVIARIGLSLLLGNILGWGLPGYWWGHAIAGYVSVVLGWAYFFFGHWERRKSLSQ